MASVVAVKVRGTETTTSPSFTPAAVRANHNASVPLLTATECPASQKAANAFSKYSTIGPPMKPAERMTDWNTAVSSCSSSTCGVTRSRNAMLFEPLIFIRPPAPDEFVVRLSRDYPQQSYLPEHPS